MNQEYPRKCIHCGEVEVLAQPAQDFFERGKEIAKWADKQNEQPAQEPVAWMDSPFEKWRLNCIPQVGFTAEIRELLALAFEGGRQSALESQEQEPVACPYPCGWNNLLEITTRKGAYLITNFDADKKMPYSYWQEISSMVDTARTLVRWGMKLTYPAKQLSDDEIEEVLNNSPYCEVDAKPFARAIEAKIRGK